MATPNVLVRLHYYEKGSKGRDFYSSEKKDDYLNYIDKGIKASKVKDYLDYAGDKEKSSGLFNASGLLSNDDKKEIRKELRKTDSTLWDCVISFEEEYGKENVFDWKQARELLTKTINGFFRAANLNPENMVWMAGLHENTDNRHIHLEFFEKKPTHYDCRKKNRIYRRGKIPINSVNSFKASIAKHFMTPVESAKRVRKIMLESAAKAVSGDYEIDLEGFSFIIRKLYDEIPLEGELSYSSSNMNQCRKDVDNASSMIIANNSNNNSWKKFEEEIRKHDEEVKLFCQSENLDASGYLFNSCFHKDLKRRMGNVIIKEVVKLRREEKERIQNLHHPKAVMKCHQAALLNLIKKTVYINMKAETESWNTFAEFEKKLKEAEYQRLVEEGKIDPNQLEIDEYTLQAF